MANIIKAIKNHKKTSFISIVILGIAGYFFLKPSSGDEMIMVYNYGTAEIGTVMQSVSGTGQISPARKSDLKSKAGGLVLAVNVSAGDKVKSGDVIARIDDSDAQMDVEDARTALESAQLSLEELNEPPDELSLMQAQNALQNAKQSLTDDQEDLIKAYEDGFDAVVDAFADLPSIVAGLQDIVAGASTYVTQSNSTYIDYYSDAIKGYDSQASQIASNAAGAYQQAKTQYDANFQAYKLMDRNLVTRDEIENIINQTYSTSQSIAEALKNTGVLIQRYSDVLLDKNLTPQTFAGTQLTSLAAYMSKNNSHVSSLYSAEQSIINAQKAIDDDEYTIAEKTKSLENLIAAPDELDVRSAKLAVEQKERALADAIEELQNYIITAPFDGIVASVEIEIGDEISSGATVSTIITGNQVATITLNEIDIAKVEIGQKTSLTFSAIDGLTMAGEVIEISALGSVSQGVVSYDVVIALDAIDEQVKSGMSISATIITDIRQNVLTVPLTAVKSDMQGNSYVLIPSDENNKQQVVTAGLSDDEYVEIIDGLAEGDKIVISSSKQNVGSSSPQGSSGSGGSNSLFNIGGMGGPMR